MVNRNRNATPEEQPSEPQDEELTIPGLTPDMSLDDKIAFLAKINAQTNAALRQAESDRAEQKRAELERDRNQVVADHIADPVRAFLSDEIWALIEQREAIGFRVVREMKDGAQTLSINLVPKSAPAPASGTATRKAPSGDGTKRDLKGDFGAVATPEQTAHVASLNNSGRAGAAWYFMNKVVNAENPQAVAVPTG
jgi:hypothetical protein